MISGYKQALDYLQQSFPKGKLKHSGELGLKRQLFLLKCLDNPQNRYPVIHLAGTSGKGSTASYVSRLLVGHGFKVGLTVSPHLFDVRERIQINNQPVSQEDFVALLNKIIPAIEKTKDNGFGNPTYFEIMVTMFYLAFYLHRVDYAVVETGMGGFLDSTNVVISENKIAVITRLGLDHTGILGSTISKIAWQKAGIIHPKNIIVSPWQYKNARLVLDQKAQSNQSPLFYIKKGTNYKNIHLQKNGLIYDFNFDGLAFPKLFLNTIALYQVENSALALGVLKLVGNRDNFKVDSNIVKKILSNFNFAGRMNVFKVKNSNQKSTTVIFDGAHNPQKVSGFVKSLKFSFPGKQFIFVVAFKQKKEAKKMLKEIITLADKIILTGFGTDNSQTIIRLIGILKSLNFNRYQVINDPVLAVKTATDESTLVAVTGSLYLLSKIYPYLK